jgi:hypothetical protein
MTAKSIALPWRENALALALGLAIIGFGAGLAHSQTPAAQPTSAQTQQATAPVASGFSCQAEPGSWCDLRDWRGFAQAFSQPESSQPEAK